MQHIVTRGGGGRVVVRIIMNTGNNICNSQPALEGACAFCVSFFQKQDKGMVGTAPFPLGVWKIYNFEWHSMPSGAILGLLTRIYTKRGKLLKCTRRLSFWKAIYTARKKGTHRRSRCFGKYVQLHV